MNDIEESTAHERLEQVLTSVIHIVENIFEQHPELTFERQCPTLLLAGELQSLLDGRYDPSYQADINRAIEHGDLDRFEQLNRLKKSKDKDERKTD